MNRQQGRKEGRNGVNSIEWTEGNKEGRKEGRREGREEGALNRQSTGW